MSRSKKIGCKPQLIRYDTSVDAGAPNQSLTLSVNAPLKATLACVLNCTVVSLCANLLASKLIVH